MILLTSVIRSTRVFARQPWTNTSVLGWFAGSAPRQLSTSVWRQGLYEEVLEGEQKEVATECELMANRYFHLAASGHQLLLIQPYAIKARQMRGHKNSVLRPQP